MGVLGDRENKLLKHAVRHLPKEYQSFFLGCIKKQIESSQWFYRALFFSLAQGVEFEFQLGLTSAAQYHHTSKKVKINHVWGSGSSDCFIVHYVRHEITHALDLRRFHHPDPAAKKALFEDLEHYTHLANVFINALVCIQKTGYVNTTILKQLPLLREHSGDLKGQFLLFSTPDDSAEKRYLGSTHVKKMWGNVLQIINSWQQSPDLYIQQVTFDIVQGDQLFDQSLSQRELMGMMHLESHYHQFIPQHQRALFQSLPDEESREALNTLYVILLELQRNIQFDSICYQQFTRCLTEKKENCIISFIDCLPETFSSQLEIRAVFQERAEANFLPIETISSLCYLPPEVVLSANTKLADTAQDPLSLARIGPAVLSSAGHSFINELSSAYAECFYPKDVSFYVLCANAGYVVAIGSLNYCLNEKNSSFMLQIVLPLLLTYLNRGNTHSFANHCVTAATSTLQMMSSTVSSTLTEYAVGMMASSVGKLAAQSLSRWMGWNKTKTTIPTVEVLEGAERENPFKNEDDLVRFPNRLR